MQRHQGQCRLKIRWRMPVLRSMQYMHDGFFPESQDSKMWRQWTRERRQAALHMWHVFKAQIRFLQEVIAKNLASLQKLETYDPRITVPCEDVLGRVQSCPQHAIFRYFTVCCTLVYRIIPEEVMDHRKGWCSIQYWCFAPGLPLKKNLHIYKRCYSSIVITFTNGSRLVALSKQRLVNIQATNIMNHQLACIACKCSCMHI